MTTFKSILQKIFIATGIFRRYESDIISIYKPDRIGDFILAIGAIRTIMFEYGSKRIQIIVSESVYPLAVHIFPKAQIISIKHVYNLSFTRGFLKCVQSIISIQRFITGNIVSLRHHPSPKELMMFDWLIRKGQNIYINPSGLGFRASSFLNGLERGGIMYPKHCPDGFPRELEANRLIVSAVLGRELSISAVIPEIPGSKIGKAVHIFPFGSAGIRTYPLDKLAESIERSNIPKNVSMLVCGDKRDMTSLEGLSKQLFHLGFQEVKPYCAESLSDLIQSISQSIAVIGVESAGCHISTALNRRTVVIIGGGHYGIFGPWRRSDRQVWVANRIFCYLCDWRCTQSSVRCIIEISTQSISSAINKVLDADEEL